MRSTFTDLWKNGKNLACTFSYNDDTKNNAVAGTMQIEGEKKNVRAEFTMTDANGAATTASVIRKGSTVYLWSSKAPRGVKMTVSSDNESLFGGNGQKPNDIDERRNVDFSCKSWSPDDAAFTPPATMQFVDVTGLTELQKAATKNLPQKTPLTNRCTYCDTITDATAKAQCKSSFGCN